MKSHILSISIVVISAAFVLSCASVDRGADLAAEYYDIAEGYAALSKYDKAIEFYQRAARAKEFEGSASYGLARVYALSGKWDEACRLFESLYVRDPKNTFTASAYAFSLASFGKTDEALFIYETLYYADMENPSLARNYAEILVLAGKFQEALDQIDYIKQQFPDTDATKDIDALQKKAENGLHPPADSADDTKKDPDAKPEIPGKGALPPPGQDQKKQ